MNDERGGGIKRVTEKDVCPPPFSFFPSTVLPPRQAKIPSKWSDVSEEKGTVNSGLTDWQRV